MTPADPPTDQPNYPFPDDGIRAHMARGDKPVCGGYTTLEWNQRGARDVAFGCSHGCGWHVVVGTTNHFHVLLMFEIAYADQLHHEAAWAQLGERETLSD